MGLEAVLRDAYQGVTDRILAKLEEGVVPWRQPWVVEPPRNLVSRKPYRGVNVFLLDSCGYASPYWLTYRQAQSLGGHVRRGESGTRIVFWKWIEHEEEEKQFPLLRLYSVFNLEQCDGLPEPPPATAEPLASAEQIIAGMPNSPKIEHRESKAYYSPLEDYINMPRIETFPKQDEYYATLFHELTHSTGHPLRLRRLSRPEFCLVTHDGYAREELVAEMGAAFLCSHAGIANRTLENQAAYIANWLEVLENDKRLVITAGAQAQRAVDYIIAQGPG